MDDMSEAHRRDYQQQRRIKDLLDAIDDFCGAVPDTGTRLSYGTHNALKEARKALQAQAEQIDAVWN